MVDILIDCLCWWYIDQIVPAKQIINNLITISHYWSVVRCLGPSSVSENSLRAHCSWQWTLIVLNSSPWDSDHGKPSAVLHLYYLNNWFKTLDLWGGMGHCGLCKRSMSSWLGKQKYSCLPVILQYEREHFLQPDFSRQKISQIFMGQ